MKKLRIIAVVAALGLGIGGYAVARTLHGHMRHGKQGMDMCAHFAEAYTQFAPLDANKDGHLSGEEKDALGKALADGALSVPPHAPPLDAFPSAEDRLDHIAEMFSRIASHDVNKDGALDQSEQASLRNAFEQGAFQLHPSPKLRELPKSLHSR